MKYILSFIFRGSVGIIILLVMFGLMLLPPAFIPVIEVFDTWWVLGSAIFICYSVITYGYYSEDETDFDIKTKLKAAAFKALLGTVYGVCFFVVLFWLLFKVNPDYWL
jgi:hypothetical protein